MTASIASRDAVPPPCEPVSYIELESTKDSKIVGVSVYSGRAEITRLFTFDVKTGQNQVNIAGLPAVLDEESVKVEGRGTATIHDVTISRITAPPNQTISAELESLLFDQKANEKALKRAQRALSTLETYMASISAANLDVSKLGDIVKNYDETARNLDYDVTNFEVESKNLASAIDAERLRLNGPIIDEKLNVKVAIGLFADFEGEIEVAVIYAVGNANWMAGYDIRVDMQAHENPITLVYKASITQNTGENWSDVPLTLETATLSFGIGVPTLHPWALTTQAPYFALHSQNIAMTSAKRLKRSDSPPRASLTRVLSRTAEPDLTSSWASRAAAPIAHRELQVSSMGNVTATFRVPGLIDIPSDGIGHNVTIVKLLLGADMSWVCVPKQDARVHLKAKIKNASDYTLLAGKASVYVDGSFISRSNVPPVNPGEKFDCPLGLDPSVRVTYHPRTKKVSQSGFYTKSSNYTFTQYVSVYNTKPSSTLNKPLSIKIIDQIPISEDSLINVKLIQPALLFPNTEGIGSNSNVAASNSTGKVLKIPEPLKVSSSVVAIWDGADEVGQDEVNIEALGKEGRFAWVCDLPPQGKITLTSQWEVAASSKTTIYGL